MLYEVITNGDDLICIHISSSMSGTLQSANIAKDHVDYKGIHIIDSRTVTVQLGLMVLEACEMRQRGASVDEILSRLIEMINDTILYASIATLKYLKKGGRIKATSAVIGSALNIKPIITISDGLVESISKASVITSYSIHYTKLYDIKCTSNYSGCRLYPAALLKVFKRCNACVQNGVINHLNQS